MTGLESLAAVPAGVFLWAGFERLKEPEVPLDRRPQCSAEDQPVDGRLQHQGEEKERPRVSYGIGHGGCEAFLLLGLTYISNLVLYASVNGGAPASGRRERTSPRR